MLKESSKRRRTKAELNQDRLVEEKDKADTKKRLAEFEAMKAERDALKERVESNGAAADILTDLISKRHVVQNPDGSCIVPSANNSIFPEEQPAVKKKK